MKRNEELRRYLIIYIFKDTTEIYKGLWAGYMKCCVSKIADIFGQQKKEQAEMQNNKSGAKLNDMEA